MSFDVHPITFEVIKNALDSIADQAAIALFRSAYSPIVRDSLDYSTAIFDGQGQMLAQGLTTAMHIGSFPDPMRQVVETYDGRMEPGDIYVLNDPYGSGGMHLPDLYVIKPVFFAGAVVGFVTTLTHLADVGGMTPGSTPVHSTEIYQEGLRIPLMKLYDRGVPNETLFNIIKKNTRLPVKVIGDIRAQVAGCTTAEQPFLQLFEKYGSTTLNVYFSEMLDYAERVMREAIAQIPDGDYSFTDYIDGLGEDPQPLTFAVTVTITGDTMRVDWTGTSPQVKAGINQVFAVTKAATYLAARLLVPQDIPNSAGYMRPLETLAPVGTIVNPHEPASCATYGLTACRCVDTLFGALAKAVPHRMPACGEGGNYWPTIGGYQSGKPFVYVESVMGSWGGRPDRDGTEGVPHPAGNQPNQPIEMVEAGQPLAITRYGFVPDTGGAGRYRGGLSLCREYRVLADEAVLILRTDKRKQLPYGLNGGQPGTPSWNILNPGPDQRLLPVLPMEAVPLKKNDVLRIVLAGGGGYGDPLERDPERVLADVLDEKLTVEYVRREYGVEIKATTSDNATTLELDVGATARLREQLARSGGGC